MKYLSHCLLSIAIALLILPFGSPARADDVKEPKKQNTGSEAKSQATKSSEKLSGDTTRFPTVPIYEPPIRGTPGGRVGGGTRSAEESLSPPRLGRLILFLSVLAPDHAGFTVQEQPDLYWYLSEPSSYPIILTLSNDHEIKPTLEVQITGPSESGIQRIRLADYNVRLQRGTEYSWFVSIVVDDDKRSKDILTGGIIELLDQRVQR